MPIQERALYNKYLTPTGYRCPNCGQVQHKRKLNGNPSMICRRCGAITTRCGDQRYVDWYMPESAQVPKPPTLTVWDSAGRELVAHECEAPENNRIGLYCFVAAVTKGAAGQKDYTHVYFENMDFTGPCYFFWSKKWWFSPAALTMKIAFEPPRHKILKSNIEQLELQLFQLRKELNNEICNQG